MKQHIIILAIGVITLNSCSLYTSYSRPEINTHDSLYRDMQIAEDSLNTGDIAWDTFFTDPYLQNLIRQALENNTDLKAAHLRTEQAQALLKAAKLAYTPSLNMPIQGGLGSFDFGTLSKTYNLPLAASWEVDIFGRLHNSKKRAAAAVEQSEEYKQAVQSSLIAATATSYYTLLFLDSQLEISEQTAANWKTNVETMRELKKAGMVNQAAVSQSEANYYAIEASLHNLHQQIYEVENTLSLILGKAPHDIERSKLAEQDIPENFLLGVPVQLLNNRPDVRSAELALAQAYYATNEARASFYPSLMLSGSAGWTNSVGNVIVNPGKVLLSAAGSLTQPIFNQGKNRAQLKISKAQQEEALLNFQQTILNAGAEVINAMKQIETANNKTLLREQQIASLETAVENTELLMKYGSSTYLEVLIAQQSLLSAQLNQQADNYEKILGVINLYHALGGGRDIE